MIRKGDKKVNKMLFIYLKEEFGVYKYSYEINSACVQGYLKKNGIKSHQFIDDNLVNIVDSVDDIMIEEYKNIVFFIDYKNERVSKLISREIKANYEDTNIIWFGQVSNYEQHLQEEYVDIVIFENTEKVLLEIANEIEPSRINGIAYIENDEVILTEAVEIQEEEISPYSEGLIDSSKLTVLQVKGINKDYILRELESLSQIAKGRLIEIVSRDVLKIDGIEEIAGKVEGLNLAGTINIENLNEHNLVVLNQGNFKVVTILINGEDYLQNLNLLSEERNIKFNVYIVTDKETLNQQIIEKLKGLHLGEIVIVDKNSGNYSYLDVQGETSLYKMAMLNGISASTTGLYPENIIGNCSKHITVDKETITAKDYEYLKDFLSINSAVIHRSDSSKGYRENIAESEKGSCYLPHYHKVDKNQQVYIDNSNIVKKLNFVNYSEAHEGIKDSYLRIETKEDIESLIKDVNYFRETGTIKSYVAQNKVENECRWTSNGTCKLKSLVRFNVKEAGEVLPCSGCSHALGNIKEGYNANVRKIYKHMDKTHIARECSSCEVHDRCSKCSMMLDTLEDTSYCSIRRSNPEIGEYFTKKSILSYLISSTNTFRYIDCANIKFSTQYTTNVFPREKTAQGESLIQPYICLTFVGEDPVLIELSSGSINKISKELAFVIEGLIKGFDTETIKDELESIIDTKVFDKDLIVDTCISFLSKNNYTKVVV